MQGSDLFLPSIMSQAPADGMVLPTFKGGLPTLITLICTPQLSHRHAQRLVFSVSLELIKLTAHTSHPRYKEFPLEMSVHS